MGGDGRSSGPAEDIRCRVNEIIGKGETRWILRDRDEIGTSAAICQEGEAEGIIGRSVIEYLRG